MQSVYSMFVQRLRNRMKLSGGGEGVYTFRRTLFRRVNRAFHAILFRLSGTLYPKLSRRFRSAEHECVSRPRASIRFYNTTLRCSLHELILGYRRNRRQQSRSAVLINLYSQL